MTNPATSAHVSKLARTMGYYVKFSLNPSNLFTIMLVALPSRYLHSSPEDLARALAKLLGMQVHEEPYTGNKEIYRDRVYEFGDRLRRIGPMDVVSVRLAVSSSVEHVLCDPMEPTECLISDLIAGLSACGWDAMVDSHSKGDTMLSLYAKKPRYGLVFAFTAVQSKVREVIHTIEARFPNAMYPGYTATPFSVDWQVGPEDKNEHLVSLPLCVPFKSLLLRFSPDE